MLSSKLFLALPLVLGFSCSDMDSRQETADKWKPILVRPVSSAVDGSYDPPNFGQTVALDFFFIAPEGQAPLTAQGILPEAGVLTYPALLTVTSGAETSKYSGLELIRIRAELPIPAFDQLQGLGSSREGLEVLRFAYELLVSDGSRELTVKGDVPVYKDDQVAQATWNLEGSTIDIPGEGESGGLTRSLKAEVSNPQNESVKIGWYVSAGKVKNRRAVTTDWTLPGTGSYTVIFTVKGKTSRTGTLIVRQITGS